MRYNREGGGQGNELFEAQCQTVAKLFRAMVLRCLYRCLASTASLPFHSLLSKSHLCLQAACPDFLHWASLMQCQHISLWDAVPGRVKMEVEGMSCPGAGALGVAGAGRG